MWLISMNISNPRLQLMSFTYVMCRLDYLIMFVLPADVADRCLLEYGEIRRDSSRCAGSLISYEGWGAKQTAAHTCVTAQLLWLATTPRRRPDKHIHCHNRTETYSTGSCFHMDWKNSNNTKGDFLFCFVVVSKTGDEVERIWAGRCFGLCI